VGKKILEDPHAFDRESVEPQRTDGKVKLGRGLSHQWKPPPTTGMMKINVNASVSKNKKISSAVAIARDTTRSFLGASAFVLEGFSDPETMEVMTGRD
jgi:hypothetical protein